MTLPPAPTAPQWQQLLYWISRPLDLMQDYGQRYGEIFYLNGLGSFPSLVIAGHPQAIQTILAPDNEDFEAPGEVNRPFLRLLGSSSVITLSGKQHQRQRQLMIPPFHGERMRAYGETIGQICQTLLQSWPVGKSFAIRPVTQDITLKVMMQAVLGLYAGERAERLESLLGKMMDDTSSTFAASFLLIPALQKDLGPLTPWGQFLQRQREVDQLLFAEIQDRRAHLDPNRSDILSLLMSARDEEGQAMTNQELRDELITLLVAGHETTATALAWAFYWLHKVPQTLEKLQQELVTLGETLDLNTLLKLPYLNAVCCETLRICPVAMLTFPRMAKRRVALMDYELEAGTLVMGSIPMVHQREDLYPQPSVFKPERFLERQYSPYEFVPFGGGARRCIGATFALFEMKLVLYHFLSRADFALLTSGTIKQVRRGLVTAPDRPIHLQLKTRRSKEVENLARAIP